MFLKTEFSIATVSSTFFRVKVGKFWFMSIVLVNIQITSFSLFLFLTSSQFFVQIICKATNKF